MKIILAYFLILLSLISFNSCGSSVGGSEAGNPEPVQLALVGYSSSAAAQSGTKALQVLNLQVNTAKLVLGEMRLLPFSFCDGSSVIEEDSFVFAGPFVVDLLASPPSPLEGIQASAGLYCEFQMRLERLEVATGADDFPLGSSVYIKGFLEDGLAFQVLLEEDEEFKLKNESAGFSIDASLSEDSFFIAFDLDQWFEGVDLKDPSIEVSMDAQGNSIIFIDQSHNTSVREIIINNLELSSDLFEDQDKDGLLDPVEQDDSLAQGSLGI